MNPCWYFRSGCGSFNTCWYFHSGCGSPYGCYYFHSGRGSMNRLRNFCTICRGIFSSTG
jgi:hypothetical protein